MLYSSCSEYELIWWYVYQVLRPLRILLCCGWSWLQSKVSPSRTHPCLAFSWPLHLSPSCSHRVSVLFYSSLRPHYLRTVSSQPNRTLNILYPFRYPSPLASFSEQVSEPQHWYNIFFFHLIPFYPCCLYFRLGIRGSTSIFNFFHIYLIDILSLAPHLIWSRSVSELPLASKSITSHQIVHHPNPKSQLFPIPNHPSPTYFTVLLSAGMWVHALRPPSVLLIILLLWDLDSGNHAMRSIRRSPKGRRSFWL